MNAKRLSELKAKARIAKLLKQPDASASWEIVRECLRGIDGLLAEVKDLKEYCRVLGDDIDEDRRNGGQFGMGA